MKIKVHEAEQIPEINSLCLVFYKERLFQPDVCYYLDNTDINIEQFGDGEGFYERSDDYAHNKVDPNIILGWVNLYELDEKLKEPDQAPIDCPLCHNKLREYVGMDGDWICKFCDCMSGDPELWEVLATKCRQLDIAVDALSAITATPLNSRVIHDVGNKALEEINQKEQQ